VEGRPGGAIAMADPLNASTPQVLDTINPEGCRYKVWFQIEMYETSHIKLHNVRNIEQIDHACINCFGVG
jgi:acetyl-CoA carboxylase alpha subunit